MSSRRLFISLLCLGALAAALLFPLQPAAKDEQRYLYVASPGIRNYTEFGGVGILVFDINNNHKFVKRIPTWDWKPGQTAENVKGVEASAKTAKIYVSTPKRIACFDLLTEKKVWDKEYEGGADRMSLSPDGKILYVPSFEKEHWHAVDALTGEVLKKLVLNSGAHNTIYGANGKEVYLAGLKSPHLSIADPKTHTVARTVGPFSHSIRPFTVNGIQTLVFVNVNELLGFEIGDLKTGKMLHRIEVQGYPKGPVKRHGCPSHGIGMTPDETEIWLADGHNESVHIFDNTVMPPKQIKSLKLREQPGWVTFSIDGKYAYPSTGEVFVTKSKQLVVALSDEEGRQVHSEKMLEIDFANGKPIRVGDQFGIGQKR
ncbi:MAG TPA: PQQ-binding-like beta-propeller repeat protein [Blastocatellia bacterium]|nr:PQQ-binding-like beta-propeller repeat protein [Blastocatellia bacterium]